MARDRQRSKARKRARAAQDSKSGKPSRAREVGADDERLDESDVTDNTPAPDPLKNTSADVDQAKLAETGIDRPEPGEAVDLSAEAEAEYDDRDRAPDEVELPPDLAAEGSRGVVDPAVRDLAAPRKDRGKLVTFLRGCVDELRRVQWPDRPHVFQATAVVLGFCVVAGLYLGAMDALIQPLIEAIL